MEYNNKETKACDIEQLTTEFEDLLGKTFLVMQEQYIETTKNESSTCDLQEPSVDPGAILNRKYSGRKEANMNYIKDVSEVHDANLGICKSKTKLERNLFFKEGILDDTENETDDVKLSSVDTETKINERILDVKYKNMEDLNTELKKINTMKSELEIENKLQLKKYETMESAETESKIYEIEQTFTETSGFSPDLNDSIDFTLSKKKKKKKVRFYSDITTPAASDTHTLPQQVDNLVKSDEYSADTTSDYTYEYLLTRAFNMMRKKNPNLDEEGKKKLTMKPPQVLRAGTKKTSFVNFLEICKFLHRTPHHLQSFLLTEFGTCGSVDGNGQLVIKGRFQQKQIESVLRKYIKAYVTCHTCHSPSTVLERETRLCFLQCEVCGSRCSVASIKSGFQAVISKRAAIRAKAV